MNEYSLSKPKFYLKHIDDILADDILTLNLQEKNRLTIQSFFLADSFQMLIIKIFHFKSIKNRAAQNLSKIFKIIDSICIKLF